MGPAPIPTRLRKNLADLPSVEPHVQGVPDMPLQMLPMPPGHQRGQHAHHPLFGIQVIARPHLAVVVPIHYIRRFRRQPLRPRLLNLPVGLLAPQFPANCAPSLQLRLQGIQPVRFQRHVRRHPFIPLVDHPLGLQQAMHRGRNARVEKQLNEYPLDLLGCHPHGQPDPYLVLQPEIPAVDALGGDGGKAPQLQIQTRRLPDPTPHQRLLDTPVVRGNVRNVAVYRQIRLQLVGSLRQLVGRGHGHSLQPGKCATPAFYPTTPFGNTAQQIYPRVFRSFASRNVARSW